MKMRLEANELKEAITEWLNRRGLAPIGVATIKDPWGEPPFADVEVTNLDPQPIALPRTREFDLDNAAAEEAGRAVYELVMRVFDKRSSIRSWSSLPVREKNVWALEAARISAANAGRDKR